MMAGFQGRTGILRKWHAGDGKSFLSAGLALTTSHLKQIDTSRVLNSINYSMIEK